MSANEGIGNPRSASMKDLEVDDVVEMRPGEIDTRNEVQGSQLFLLHSTLCLANFLAGLDFNVIATAIPTITSRFHSTDDVGWYGSAFYIALCATQPLSGKVYVLFSKKMAFVSYIAVFEVGSLICALASSSHVLIIGRAIAGLGASGIFAGTLVIMTSVMPIHKRAIWQSTLIATFGIASIVGPVIGGGLTQRVSWRWCFYINLPIGGLIILLVQILLGLEPSRTEQVSLAAKLKSLDAVGCLLFSGAVCMLLLALQWGGITYPWSSSVVIGLFVGCSVTVLTFLLWQKYLDDDALIPPKVLMNRNVILLSLGAIFANGPFQTIIYYLPIWFQIQGATPTASGVKYLPTVISDVLTSFIAGGIVMQIGHWKPFNLFGYVLLSLGSGFLTRIFPGVYAGRWIGLEIMVGVGCSLAVSMPQLGVQATLGPDVVHIGSTTLLFAMSISCAVSLALGQVIFQTQLSHYLASAVPSDTVKAIMDAGVSEIKSVVRPGDQKRVIQEYSNALTDIFLLPAIGPAISFICVFFTTWTTLQTTKETVEDEPPRSDTAKEKEG